MNHGLKTVLLGLLLLGANVGALRLAMHNPHTAPITVTFAVNYKDYPGNLYVEDVAWCGCSLMSCCFRLMTCCSNQRRVIISPQETLEFSVSDNLFCRALITNSLSLFPKKQLRVDTITVDGDTKYFNGGVFFDLEQKDSVKFSYDHRERKFILMSDGGMDLLLSVQSPVQSARSPRFGSNRSTGKELNN